MNKITSFFSKLKPRVKYILGILGIAAIVSQGAFAFTKLSATTPRFNFLSGDYELLRGVNSTAGETVWRDPITGNAGDTFQGIVYYHNGMVNTTAENTRIKVTIPAQTTNKSANLTARISADNAETVADTIVDGQIVGLSGLTVNLDQNATLDLVPGSVKWYPNQQNNPDVPVIFPTGQSGDEIVDTSGVNIGDIQGCWQYSGYVVFSFVTSQITVPGLDVDKTVRNVTAGEIAYVETTSAASDNEVEFKVASTNTGTATANDAVIKDSLPADLSFVSGSMKIYRGGAVISENLPDTIATQIFTSGWNMGDLQVGAANADTLVFKAKAPSSILAAKSVTNTAEVSSSSLSDSDTASVSLVPDESSNIIPNKTAKNLTSGQIASPRTIAGRTVLATDALAGQSIEYTLITKNTGNATAVGYIIQDGIADILEYSDIISVSDGGSVVDGTSGNDVKLVKYPAIDIAGGQTVIRTFTVKIKDPIPGTPASGFHFDMQMYNQYGDEVIIFLSIPTPPQKYPILHVEKLVRDFTINEINFVDANSAIAGDTLEYKILFSNTGDGPADQVKFSDVLPANMNYIAGTTVISVNGEIEHTLPDGIISGGVMLDTIAAGDTGYIKFKVITDAGIANGTTLVNTASLTDNGVSISDTASTIFKALAVQIAVPTTPLPRTGADSVSIAAILSVILTGAGMLVYRRFA